MTAEASYDLSSHHSPILVTISSFIIHKKPPNSLHNKRTNWEQYRTEIEANIDLQVRLQTPTEMEAVLTNLTTTLTKAAEQATSKLQPSNLASNNISLEIKRLIAVKRKARATWHQTHVPQDKTALNRATNQLKIKIKDEKDRALHTYITGLNRFDNTIWKPLQYRKKPQQ
jgi:hypothetical protein